MTSRLYKMQSYNCIIDLKSKSYRTEINLYYNKTSDERGLYIAGRALKFSWIFYSIILFLWSLAELIINGSTQIFFIIIAIFLAGQIIFWSFYLYYLKKYSG